MLVRNSWILPWLGVGNLAWGGFTCLGWIPCLEGGTS